MPRDNQPDAATTLIFSGLLSTVSAFLGCPFPCTVYIGQPTFYAAGAGFGYSLINGTVMLLLTLFMVMPFVNYVVPNEALTPVLVLIGVDITAQAFLIAIADSRRPVPKAKPEVRRNSYLRCSAITAATPLDKLLAVVYFVLFVTIVGLFFMQLLIGVFAETFTRHNGHALLTRKQRYWVELQRRLSTFGLPAVRSAASGGLRAVAQAVVDHPAAESTVYCALAARLLTDSIFDMHYAPNELAVRSTACLSACPGRLSNAVGVCSVRDCRARRAACRVFVASDGCGLPAVLPPSPHRVPVCHRMRNVPHAVVVL
jgi:hypothetical protein